MKKLIKTVVELIEKHGEFVPFDSSEPVKTNSQK